MEICDRALVLVHVMMGRQLMGADDDGAQGRSDVICEVVCSNVLAKLLVQQNCCNTIREKNWSEACGLPCCFAGP